MSAYPEKLEAPAPETVEVSETIEPASLEERRAHLFEALKERFSMDDEDAQAIASVVSESFAGNEEVNDETLDPEVRSIFYTLEAKKLLSFRRTEYTIDTGERRRAFFWRVRDDELARIHELKQQVVEQNIYDALPKSVWNRGAS